MATNKLFGLGQLTVFALHYDYTEFQAIYLPSHEISMTERASFSPLDGRPCILLLGSRPTHDRLIIS